MRLIQFCSILIMSLRRKDNFAYEEWKRRNRSSLIHILEEFESLRPDCHFLLTHLPKLQPRFYSVSSSPHISNDIHLTVGFVVKNIVDKTNYGVCSKWLADLPNESLIPASIRK